MVPFSERSAGPALVSLFSTCTLSLAPQWPWQAWALPHCPVPTPRLLLVAGFLGAQNKNKASHHTRLAGVSAHRHFIPRSRSNFHPVKKTAVLHPGSLHHETTSGFHGGVKAGRNLDQDQRQAHRGRLGWNNLSSCCGRSLVGESCGQAGGKATIA